MRKTITTAEPNMSAQSVHTDNTVDTCANRQKWYEVWQSTGSHFGFWGTLNFHEAEKPKSDNSKTKAGGHPAESNSPNLTQSYHLFQRPFP